jgi:hypothetical protein
MDAAKKSVTGLKWKKGETLGGGISKGSPLGVLTSASPITLLGSTAYNTATRRSDKPDTPSRIMKVLRSTFVEGGNKIDILAAHGNWNRVWRRKNQFIL